MTVLTEERTMAKNSKKKENLLEIRNGLVHADSGNGCDTTLCCLTAEKCISSLDEYDESRESCTEPYLMYVSDKINCPKCAETIRYCCKLGLKSISDKVNNEIIDFS